MNFPGGAVPSTHVPAASLYGTMVQPNIMAWSSCARLWQWARLRMVAIQGVD